MYTVKIFCSHWFNIKARWPVARWEEVRWNLRTGSEHARMKKGRDARRCGEKQDEYAMLRKSVTI